MGTKVVNLTMAIDGDLLKSARKVAIEKDTTVSGLVREYLRDLVRREAISETQVIEDIESLCSGGHAVVGPRTWSRDDLHDRR